ncbi:MAG: SUMF1/EgtB/PvdO family nonheme iron enzyme [Phycisphaerales bacterium]|nr:SUMF1/EgtB/PvdO family nonheme iron enzyme [Phycisphaerales bacterium]
MRRFFRIVGCAILFCGAGLRAEVIIETVPIGNPGNPGTLSGQTVNIQGTQMGSGNDRVCGAVSYPFEIAKYEVTVRQYVEFLNAVAAADPYALFSGSSSGVPDSNNIIRSGTAGSYTYQIGDGSQEALIHWGDRAVGGIAWCDAARFANWMQNGQPTGVLSGNGAADAGLTEDGTYATLGAAPSGANSNQPYQPIVRHPGATWVIPSEDEWFKAAYHKNDGITANYFTYPTSSSGGGVFVFSTPENNIIDPDPGNSANYHIGSPDDDCVGPPYNRSNVGEFENSASPYGTFDQGGNVWEWTDTRYLNVNGGLTLRRIIRGASYYPSVVQQQPDGFMCMHSAWREDQPPVAGVGRYGFRLARVNNDCNGNGQVDQAEIAAGTAHDYNYNGILDDCDIAAGTSEDCNENGIPDEAEVGRVTPPAYLVDDGEPADLLTAIGYPGEESEGYIVWMNQFTTVAGRESIGGLTPAMLPQFVPAGTPFTAYLWSDEVGNGNPADAAVLASAAGTMSPALDFVDLPDTYVGPEGTKFVVGIVMHIADTNATAPATYDDSSDFRVSWFAWSATAIDPNAIAGAGTLINLRDFLGGGNWMIRAQPAVVVPQLEDTDDNGVPDECEFASVLADMNCDGVVNNFDIDPFVLGLTDANAYEAAFPDCRLLNGDVNGDGVLNNFDIDPFVICLTNSGCP